MKDNRRLTIPNPNGRGYRICLDRLSVRLESQQNALWMFGDIADELGRLEDLEAKIDRAHIVR